MKKLKRIAVGLIVGLLLLLPCTPALANWLGAPATIVNDLTPALTYSLYGINEQPTRNTFYTQGRHWIFYANDDGDFVYKTGTDEGIFGSETVLKAGTIYGMEQAVWYDAANNRLHYAYVDLSTSSVKYRMGTPLATGAVTWAAAEQTVLGMQVGMSVNYNLTITCDEGGYPWVAWVDGDGTTPDVGLVYCESSSTKNGTWTTDASISTTFQIGGGTIADGTGTLGGGGSPITLTGGENDVPVAAAGTFTVTLPKGTVGNAATDGWTVTDSPKALVEGANTITVQAGGAGNITVTTTEAGDIRAVALTPVGSSGDMMEIEYVSENIGGGANDGDMMMLSNVFNDVGGWESLTTVVAEGSLNATRPDAFSFYDLGSALRVVYTDDTGKIMFRVRSSIQTWTTADAATQLLAAGASTWVPTISGYKLADSGEYFICIVHNDAEVKYSIFNWDTQTWGAFTLAWDVPDVANDAIARHVAAYNYDGDKVTFAIQWTDDSAGADTVSYWWIDSSNNQLGYYDSGLPTNVVPMADLVPLVFLGMGVLLVLGLAMSESVDLKTILFAGVLIVIFLAFLAMMNNQVTSI